VSKSPNRTLKVGSYRKTGVMRAANTLFSHTFLRTVVLGQYLALPWQRSFQCHSGLRQRPPKIAVVARSKHNSPCSKPERVDSMFSIQRRSTRIHTLPERAPSVR
jgi:hypothetical protein